MPDSKGSHDEHVLHESAKQAQTTIKATQGGSSVSQTKKFMSLENMPVSNTVTKDGAEKESVEMCSYWQLFSAAGALRHLSDVWIICVCSSKEREARFQSTILYEHRVHCIPCLPHAHADRLDFVLMVVGLIGAIGGKEKMLLSD